MKDHAIQSRKYLDVLCHDAAEVNPVLGSALKAHIGCLLKDNDANAVLGDILQSSLFHEYEMQLC